MGDTVPLGEDDALLLGEAVGDTVPLGEDDALLLGEAVGDTVPLGDDDALLLDEAVGDTVGMHSCKAGNADAFTAVSICATYNPPPKNAWALALSIACEWFLAIAQYSGGDAASPDSAPAGSCSCRAPPSSAVTFQPQVKGAHAGESSWIKSVTGTPGGFCTSSMCILGSACHGPGAELGLVPVLVHHGRYSGHCREAGMSTASPLQSLRSSTAAVM